MAKMVGLSRAIKIEWLNKVVSLVITSDATMRLNRKVSAVATDLECGGDGG